MGRFDALTQLDKEPGAQPTPPPVVPPTSDRQPTDPLAENEIVSLPAKKQTSKEVNLQGSKLLKKFGSYLPPETIKALKRFAFDHDRKEYEVLKEAIDLYLEQQKQHKKRLYTLRGKPLKT